MQGGEFGNLNIGQAGVGFADVQQFAIGILHREGVVAEDASAAAVAKLRGGDDYVEGRKLAFQLQPCVAAASGRVERVRTLDHQAFVAALASGEESGLQLLDCFRLKHWSEQDRCGRERIWFGCECKKSALRNFLRCGLRQRVVARFFQRPSESCAPNGKRLVEQHRLIGEEAVEGKKGYGRRLQQLPAHFFATRGAR